MSPVLNDFNYRVKTISWLNGGLIRYRLYDYNTVKISKLAGKTTSSHFVVQLPQFQRIIAEFETKKHSSEDDANCIESQYPFYVLNLNRTKLLPDAFFT